MDKTLGWNTEEYSLSVTAGSVMLEGNLAVPPLAQSVVLFAHGSGSSRYSPRNRYVAHKLREAGMATLLIDLLTADEEAIDLRTKHQLRLDINFLASRLIGITDWLKKNPLTQNFRIGYFGASTGSGAALVAAAETSGCCGCDRFSRRQIRFSDRVTATRASTNTVDCWRQ